MSFVFDFFCHELRSVRKRLAFIDFWPGFEARDETWDMACEGEALEVRVSKRFKDAKET